MQRERPTTGDLERLIRAGVEAIEPPEAGRLDAIRAALPPRRRKPRAAHALWWWMGLLGAGLAGAAWLGGVGEGRGERSIPATGGQAIEAPAAAGEVANSSPRGDAGLGRDDRRFVGE